MRSHLENAVFGVLDYLAHPVGMLAVAPLLIRSLGPQHFGIWAFAMALTNTGAILGSGFGDAHIQFVAVARRPASINSVETLIRNTLTIHLALGSVLALLGYSTAHAMASRVAPGDIAICTTSFRIASIAVLFRSIETVAVSTQRAFERYGDALRISGTVRLLSLLGAAGLATLGCSVSATLACTAVMLGLGTLTQLLHLQRCISLRSLIPGLNRAVIRQLLGFGTYTWVQSAAGVMFAQLDRLVVGLWFGSVAVGSYTICMQLAQPISGTVASAFHFLFPFLARTGECGHIDHTRNRVLIASLCNLLLVATETVLVLIFGKSLLHFLAGPAIAPNAAALLGIAVTGSAVVALSVTGNYAMLALGQPRWTLLTVVVSGMAMLSSLPWLTHHYGLHGVAISRVVFGLTSLSIYIPLVRLLRTGSANSLMTQLHPALPQERA